MRYLLLDLFCGGGLAADGYTAAGFQVIGCDIKPQPHYPYEFHQADAIDFAFRYAHHFDAVHASPPCQLFSAATRDRSRHRDLIWPTRWVLSRAAIPGIIENVPAAPLQGRIVTMCGSLFGLPTLRHRKFELLFWWAIVPRCRHGGTVQDGSYHTITTHRAGNSEIGKRRRAISSTEALATMGVHRIVPLSVAGEGIPPAYTHALGIQLRDHLDATRSDFPRGRRSSPAVAIIPGARRHFYRTTARPRIGRPPVDRLPGREV